MAECKSIEERFWSKVNFFGPTPEHVPGIGNCWVWTASRHDAGYGRFRMAGETWRSHRVAWLFTNGAPPFETPCILHDCDNPSCVRPSHLHVGTRGQNAEEMEARGRRGVAAGGLNGSVTHPERIPRGERSGRYTHPETTARGDRHMSRTHPEALRRGDNHPARLHPERMRRGEAHGMSKVTASDVREIRRRAITEAIEHIALDYPIKGTAVSKIVKRLTWRHVEDVET